eukprot:Skav221449  [mRNA]  locus=scaffold1700:28306:30462:- [translate_table: standard]
MPRHAWIPPLFVSLWAVLKLERTRQYYDPYTQSRMLQGLRADAPNRQRLPSKQTASVATTDPASIVETISDSEALKSRGQQPRNGGMDEGYESVADARVPTAGEIARFVVPSCCLVIANSSMTTVDKAFLGRSSSLQLAAMGPAASVFDSASLVLTFLNTATLSLLGMSAGDPEQLRKIRSHAIFLATSSGLFLTVFLCALAGPLTRLMGATGGMLPLSMIYLQIRAIGAPIERGTSVATSFCLAAKDGATPLMVTLVSMVINVIADGIMSPRYGLAGVAGASVIASSIGYVYLILALVRSDRWPRPFSWPRNFRAISRFLRFAGPVLLAVFLKMLVLANMTTAACSFGTTVAAAHQLFQTLFLLSAVAIGNPFSWAAQAFIPPILAAFCEGREATQALLLSLTASVSVVIFCRKFGWILSSDAEVVEDCQLLGSFEEMASTSPALMPFLTLYPLLLTLEGALYGAQERSTVLWLSIFFWWLSSACVGLLRLCGILCLQNLWLAIGFSCGITTLVTAVFAFQRALAPKGYLILESSR